MHIGLDDFCTEPVESVNFTKHICATVLGYYIELEKSIIADNSDNYDIVAAHEENLEHLKASKDYIESYYKTKKKEKK